MFSLSKLLQKPDIVFEQESNIIDVIHQARHSIDSKTKGETGELFRINSHRLEHVRVNHTASTQLNPTRAFTYTTTSASAHVAAEIDFCRWLCKRKVRWPKSGPHIRTKHHLHKLLKRSFQISESNMSIDV